MENLALFSIPSDSDIDFKDKEDRVFVDVCKWGGNNMAPCTVAKKKVK
jgi:hypothetical protein